MPAIIFTKKSLAFVTLFLFIFLSVLTVLFITTNRQASENLTKETLARQLRLTQAGAINIESFMAVAGRSAILLSQNISLGNDGKARQKVLDQYVVDRLGSPVAGVILIDQKGIVIAGATREMSSSVGTNLSDREYFTWAKTASPGALYIGEPTISRVGATKGKQIIVFATPVFRNGKFDGTLAIATELQLFIDNYVSSIFPTPVFSTYLLDSQGTIIAAPNEMIGENIFTVLEQRPFFGSEIIAAEFGRILKNEESGALETIFPQGNTAILTRTLVTYSNIKAISENKQSFELIITTPQNSIVSLTAPIYIQEITMLIGIFFAVLVIFILIFTKIESTSKSSL